MTSGISEGQYLDVTIYYMLHQNDVEIDVSNHDYLYLKNKVRGAFTQKPESLSHN